MRLKTAFIIGRGEVGTRLGGALETAGIEVRYVTRHEGWADAVAADTEIPRLLCMREEDFTDALSQLAAVPASSLVSVQNGWVKPLLREPESITRGLIWFTSKGDFFRSLRPSPVHGPLAKALVEALSVGGLDVTAVESKQRFSQLEADKMGFNCVVGLPLAVHGITLGEYLEARTDEARAVFEEAAGICAQALGVEAEPSWWSSFVASCEPLGWVATSKAKALEFRNRAVVELAASMGRNAPANQALLSAVESG